MTTTAEHRADMHRLASNLRAQGNPTWSGTLNLTDVFHNDDLTFTEKRDKIVARIKRLRRYRTATDIVENHPESDDYYDADNLLSLVEELGDVETVADFDTVFDGFYDWADQARIWVKTW